MPTSLSLSPLVIRTIALTMELSALGEHLDLCKESHGRWSAVRYAAETMNGFVSARFVTTLVVVTLLIGAGSLVM